MKFGFGIVGTGAIAEVHARAIRSLDNADLIGAWNINPEKGRKFCERFECIPFESLDDLLKSPDIQIVNICTPSGAHMEPSIAAIEAGKHCMIEKPLEVSLYRCDRIIDFAKKKGAKAAVIFPLRFQDVNLELKKAIDAGRFGRCIIGDAAVKWFRNQAYYDSADWRGTWKLDGGGVLMNQGIHSVDLLQWCMGPVSSVSAYTDMLGHTRIEVEDTAVAVLRFRNGALGVIEGSTAIYPGFNKKIEILGTQGSAVVEDNSLITWRFTEEMHNDGEIRRRYSTRVDSGGGASDPKAISDLGHIRQISDMVSAIENKRPPAIDAAEARKSVEIILAIYRSSQTRSVVHLPLNSTENF
jgi:predicted dehydrogenase